MKYPPTRYPGIILNLQISLKSFYLLLSDSLTYSVTLLASIIKSQSTSFYRYLISPIGLIILVESNPFSQKHLSKTANKHRKKSLTQTYKLKPQ